MTITRQQVDAWDAEVNAAYERGRQEGMKQECALWTLTKLGQKIEAQLAQEPVAYMSPNKDEFCTVEDAGTYIPKTWLALYTTPQQRPWVGLTDEDKDEIIRVTMHDDFCDILMLVEAKLKEKNA